MLQKKCEATGKKKSKIIFWGALALLFLVFGFSKKIIDGPILKKVATARVDYVPVTDYFSPTENVTLKELRDGVHNKEIYIEEGEGKNLSVIFGESAQTAPQFKGQKLLGRIAVVKWSSVLPSQKTLSVEGGLLWKGENYPLYAEVEGGERFDASKMTKVTALGDVMLSRHVNTKIKSLGYDYPWRNVRKRISDADITFANLEVPLSDLFPAPSEGMSFIAPTKNIEVLKASGIDIVSVANNHSSNFGRKVFEDDLSNLSKGGINACGGGLSEEGASRVSILEKNGIKFGFLCYNSIIGGLRPTSVTSGMATVEIEPWFRDSQKDIARVKADIKKAKEEADVLIVSPHWGVEYKLNPNSSQTSLAHVMIDAGADVVLGTHPHVVQGAEIYKGKFIIYSLGNFIFDQEWSPETKEGVVLENYFYNDKHVSSVMVPLQIKNYSQPSFLGQLGNYIIERIKSASIGF